MLIKPSRVARRTVKYVMKENKSKGDAWQKQSFKEHIAHAKIHLAMLEDEISFGIRDKANEDHLAHALTRLAMASSIEIGDVDEKA